MLSLRFAILFSLSAVALWGLFSLLENLSEPELLRSPKAVVVKGCDPIETDEARRVCPELFCQKRLLDTRAAPRDARFEVTLHDDALIAGAVRSAAATPGHFACELEDGVILSARAISPQELERLQNASSEERTQ